jgi:hypothetical protein
LKKVIIASILLVLTLIVLQNNQHETKASEPLNIQNTIIYADNYTGTTDADKIQKAIDTAAKSGNAKTVLLGDHTYNITKPIIVKKDVKLEFSYGAKLSVNGNFRVLEMQKDASLKDAYIAIDSSNFNNDVIYLSGVNHYYNSWWRSKFENINIVNETGSHKGTAVKLYTNGKSDEISFLTFENIKIAEMGTAINIESYKALNVPYYDYGYISANNFNNIVIDNVIHGIVVSKSSGNTFSNIQFQLESTTKDAITILGSQYNKFEGMIWDGQRIPKNASPIFKIDASSSFNELNVRGDIFNYFYSDLGKNNTH